VTIWAIGRVGSATLSAGSGRRVKSSAAGKNKNIADKMKYNYPFQPTKELVRYPTFRGKSVMDKEDNTSARAQVRVSGMSYKFQRLREKLRAAIASGELAGKLPGERALAKQFHVNAKTLSKALTDLAAEGLLDRSIGRGTYVKGSAPTESAQGRWLVIGDPNDINSPLIEGLRALNPELQTASEVADMRPSFLNQFAAVIDMAPATPESFLRDLVVRSMPLVAVNREPRVYSMHSVLVDTALGVSRLGRDLILAGHRRLAAVEPRGNSSIAQTLRQSAARYARETTVDSCECNEIAALVDAGCTAVVCGNLQDAQQVKRRLEHAGIRLPAQASLTAVGACDDQAPCSGYFCTSRQIIDGVNELLKNAPVGRPTVLWLAGDFHDCGTIAPTGSPEQFDEIANVRVDGIVV
jgi:DNA-binding HxlR family transcriptional regulator